MTVPAQSIVVSQDPVFWTIPNDLPHDGIRPPFVLSEWAPPEFEMRLTYAPDQPDVPGKQLLSMALDAGTIPLVINVHGADLTELQNNRRTIEVIFSQFAYTVTVVMGTVSEVYNAFPCWPKWDMDLQSRTAVATLSVPVNPMGA